MLSEGAGDEMDVILVLGTGRHAPVPAPADIRFGTVQGDAVSQKEDPANGRGLDLRLGSDREHGDPELGRAVRNERHSLRGSLLGSRQKRQPGGAGTGAWRPVPRTRITSIWSPVRWLGIPGPGPRSWSATLPVSSATMRPMTWIRK